MPFAPKKLLTAEIAEAAEKKMCGSAISAPSAVESFWQWSLDRVLPTP